jgi:hypothetical protein
MEGVAEAGIRAVVSGIGNNIGILYLGFCLDGNGASIKFSRKIAADGGNHRSRDKAEVSGIGDKISCLDENGTSTKFSIGFRAYTQMGNVIYVQG